MDGKRKFRLLYWAMKDFPTQMKLRGIGEACGLVAINMGFVFCPQKANQLYKRKHELNLRFMQRHFPLNKYGLKATSAIDEYVIWVLWWQGEEGMPDIVKATYHSICANTAKRVVLITGQNYGEYIEIPQFIRERVERGTMQLPALSDFIRISLLDKYGGMWIDSTVLMAKKMPNDYFNRRFFSVSDNQDTQQRGDTQYVSAGQWNVQILGTNVKHYPLFQYMRNIWLDYWSRYDSLIDYLLVDYCIKHIALNDMQVGADISELPQTYKEMHLLRGCINDCYSPELFEKLAKQCCVFKLTYKDVLIKEKDGKKTFYKYILDTWK